MSATPVFSPDSGWLWGTVDLNLANQWRYFRRTLTLPPDIHRAELLITADSRYELFINGEFIGRGPARGLPFAYAYDGYDVTSLLRANGLNAIGVLANHYGQHTMAYIRSRPGLLCELVVTLNSGEQVRFASDNQWKTAPCAMFNADTPRISVQLGFEEQIDARLAVPEWANVDFEDSGWEQAQTTAVSVESGLTARTIPFLTEDPVTPQQVKAVELARIRPGIFWYLDVRELAGTVLTGIRSAPPGKRGWLIYSELHAPQPCTVRLHGFNNYESYEPFRVRINEQIVSLGEDSVAVNLHAGANRIMMRSLEWPGLLIETEQPITLSAEHLLPGAAWIFSGPFNELDGELDRLWAVEQLDDLAHLPRVAIPESANKPDIFALTSSQQFYEVEGGFCSPDIARPTPRPFLPLNSEQSEPAVPRRVIDQPNALLHHNAVWTTIYPQPDGDVHLVIDFGREIIGYLRLLIDAPEGVILDANCFEGIDESGIFWTYMLRNSFRYICRDGEQVFISHERRGFRYVSLTIRNLSRPLRIRQIDTLFSTYPVVEVGMFHCSDERLNRIWRVGADTLRLCMLDTFVDCPAYEQVYWVGDTYTSARVSQTAFGGFDLIERCIRLTAQTLDERMRIVKPPYLAALRTHLTTSHVVSGWFDEIPMWTFLWVWSAWDYWQMSGDRAYLADIYPAVAECLRRCEGFLTSRDLLDIPDVWNLIDWSAMDLERHGEVIPNTMCMALSLDQAAQMAEQLDHRDAAAAHRALAARLRSAINRYGWSDEFSGYVDTVRDETAYRRYTEFCASQGTTPISLAEFRNKQRISEQTNTLALVCNCALPERHAAVRRFVTAVIHSEFKGSSPERAVDGRPDEIVTVGTPWFLFFTLEMLKHEGYPSEALAILREQWGTILDKGATTFWETFPGYVSKHWSRSLCHGWSSIPTYLLSEWILGIEALEPGYGRIRVAPQPFDLTFAEGTILSPRGAISVRWQKQPDGTLAVQCDVPQGCIVEIVQAVVPKALS